MNVNRTVWITTTVVVLFGAVAAFFMLRGNGVGGQAFFDIDLVYDKFDMKKEMEMKMRKMDEYQNFFVDSLKFQIRALESKVIANPADKGLEEQLQRLYEQFRLTTEDFSKRNQGVADQYNKQVLSHIIDRAETYRKDQGLDLFMGRSKGTDLIFYDEKMDRTEAFLEYLNKTFAEGAIQKD